MKLSLLSGLFVCGLSTTILAQTVEEHRQGALSTAPTVTHVALAGKGTRFINAGVGVGLSYSGRGYQYSSLPNVSSLPTFSLSYEHILVEGVGRGTIGVGGILGYKQYSWQAGGYKGAWKGLVAMGRSTYHYDPFHCPKLDTYAGVSLGVRHEKYRYENTDDTGYSFYGRSGIRLQSGIFIGARYLVTGNLGVFSELGHDVSYLKAGLTARF